MTPVANVLRLIAEGKKPPPSDWTIEAMNQGLAAYTGGRLVLTPAGETFLAAALDARREERARGAEEIKERRYRREMGKRRVFD